MRKKEVVIILVLAGLVTGGSSLPIGRPDYILLESGLVVTRRGGFPFAFFEWNKGQAEKWAVYYLPLVVDCLSWFLVLAAGWWVLKWLKVKSIQ